MLHYLKFSYKNLSFLPIRYTSQLTFLLGLNPLTIIVYKQANMLGLPSTSSYDFLRSFVIPCFNVRVLPSEFCPQTIYILPQ